MLANLVTLRRCNMAGMEEFRLRSQPHYQSDVDLDDVAGQVNYYTGSYGKIGDPDVDRRPDSLPLDDGASSNELIVKRYVSLGVNLASLIAEHLLSHPFVVLRRQCQVNASSIRYHIIPITLVPVVVKLQQRQGLGALWKGVGSVLLVRGVTLALEDVLSKFTPWPKELSWHSSMKSIGQHLLLKCTSLALVTPFFSASLVETVQSEIASEKPGVLDVFREGACRLLCWSPPATGRMLPVWALVVPTVSYGLLKYLIGNTIRNVVINFLQFHTRAKQERKGALPRDSANSLVSADIELKASVAALVTADVLTYPLETVLHRIHLQGTRTITDNLDSGMEVLPILTSYKGASDCYETALSSEGSLGLFKGFGALVFQYSVHIAFLHVAKVVLTEVSNLLYPSSSSTKQLPPTVPPPHSKPSINQAQASQMPPGLSQPYRPYDDVYFQGRFPPQV
ncbi:solute carrier family 25 member 46-like [Ischnura elegans]|uniref:solute carrier family 25 member 46-like n=1 Tax=Ischnura elegans TaxID=197161 RepID=UPI001ED8BA59|nr:solute carrier family 25 member 46-like [Ischnura elegans]